MIKKKCTKIKMMTILALMPMIFSITAPVMGMSMRKASPISIANDIGNNDGTQQAVGDLSSAMAKGGQSLVNDGFDRALNQGATQSNANKIIKTGTKIFVAGKSIEYASKVAPHVGWVATSAGYASTGQYKGATVQAVNGVTRTVTVAHIGTAVGTGVGIWVGGKLGAVAGSWAGPLGAGAGFILGAGAAYVGGKIWDNSIGVGADALTQKAADWDSKSQYGGKPKTKPGGYSTGGGAGAKWGRDGARDNVRQNRPPVRRPAGGGSRPPCTCPRR